jgi:hypothetical protein
MKRINRIRGRAQSPPRIATMELFPNGLAFAALTRPEDGPHRNEREKDNVEWKTGAFSVASPARW